MARKKAKKTKNEFELANEKLDRVIGAMATKSDVEEINKKIDSTFNTLDQKIDNVIDAMVTHEDLRQLEERLDRKLDERIAKVIEAIHNLATQFGKLNIEYAAISAKLERYDRWFKILEEKTGVKLPQ